MALRDDEYALLKNKRHPLYKGVLREAIENGLLELTVKLLQAPSAENDHTAICQATAVFPGPGDRDRVFTEVGDCDNNNATAMITAHKIRMAATRAKGRALRDALGIGEALVEEIYGTDEETPRRGPQPHADRPARSKPPARRADGSGLQVDKNPSTIRPAAGVVDDDTAGEEPEPVVCEVCEQPLTEKSIAACADHSDLFDGKILCLEHRKDYRDRKELGARAKVPSGILA